MVKNKEITDVEIISSYMNYVLENESGYFGWLLNADFPMYTKKVLTQIRLNKLNNKL